MEFTKAQIIQGIARIEEVEVEGFDGKIPIKPLTDGQYTEIEEIRIRGTKVKGSVKDPDSIEMEIDLEVSTKQGFLADVKTVYYGLATTEKWTEDEIKSITPPGIVDKLAKEIYRISGVTSLDAVKKFRKNGRRR